MRWIARNAAVWIAIFMTSQSAAAQLRFDVEKPFRFFKFESDYAIHRIAFDILTDGGTDRTKVTVEQLEGKLADPDFWVRELPENAWSKFNWPLHWRHDNNGKPVDAEKKLKLIDIVERLRTKREGRQSIATVVGLGGMTPQAVIERYGWAALLDTHLNGNAKTGVCWNLHSRRHDLCPDYVLPKFWRARIFDPELFKLRLDKIGDARCIWTFFDGEKREKAILSTQTGSDGKQPCAEAFVDVPAIVGKGKTPQGSIFAVRKNEDGSETALKIEIKDRLVVGVGDSFSSGEGNPDRPVVFHPYLESFGRPRRPNDGFHWAAHWIDRSCHRSAYSWQLRSTLHQALIDPSNAVTLLAYACSGAEVVEGLFYAWAGVEPIKDRPNVGQLAAVYNELCEISPGIGAIPVPPLERDDYLKNVGSDADPWKDQRAAATRRLKDTLHCARGSTFKRPMNGMLLSVGGNDLGFSKWIAGAILKGFVEGMAGGFIPRLENCEAKDNTCNLTRARIKRLESRYGVLRDVMIDKLLMDGGLDPDKVVMKGYPKATFGSDGKVCPAGNAGMTVSIFRGVGNRSFEVRNTTELDTIEKFRRDELMRMVRDFAKSSLRDGRQIKVVEGFIEDFKNRGFCATGNDNEFRVFTGPMLPTLPRIKNEKNVIETLHFPRTGQSEPWRPVYVEEWRPYALRQRLLRTPNDVFMTINNKPPQTLESAEFGVWDLPYRATSGAFHPTAEAHSIIAKHVAPELTKVLRPD